MTCGSPAENACPEGLTVVQAKDPAGASVLLNAFSFIQSHLKHYFMRNFYLEPILVKHAVCLPIYIPDIRPCTSTVLSSTLLNLFKYSKYDHQTTEFNSVFKYRTQLRLRSRVNGHIFPKFTNQHCIYIYHTYVCVLKCNKK